METAIDKYIREHSTAQEEALEWIEKQDNIQGYIKRLIQEDMDREKEKDR